MITIQILGMDITQTIEKMGQRRLIQRAATSAHTIWSKRYKAWSESYFDEHFLRTRVQPLLLHSRGRVTAVSLANLWADQFALSDQHRRELVAEFTAAASDYLYLFDSERQTLARRPQQRAINVQVQATCETAA